MEPYKIQLTYADPFSILAVNDHGQLRRIFTPFKIQSIEPIGNIPKDAWVYVDGVWEDRNKRLLYLIYGKLYPYNYFRLKIEF